MKRALLRVTCCRFLPHDNKRERPPVLYNTQKIAGGLGGYAIGYNKAKQSILNYS